MNWVHFDQRVNNFLKLKSKNILNIRTKIKFKYIGYVLTKRLGTFWWTGYVLTKKVGTF